MRRLEQEGGLEPKRLERYLRTINGQSAKLVRLTEQLLDVSRIQAGQLALERHELDVLPLVQEVVEAAEGRTERHRISLSAPAGPLPIVADGLRLEQVLTNLLDNAVKYSPDGGPIEVEVTEAPATSGTAELHIAVRDHGLGVPPEHLPHIFERLYQGHTMNYAPGIGLGLYVARQIVELHDGRIEVETPTGGGARFVVHLPR